MSKLKELEALADAATPGPWWSGKCEPMADGHALAWIGQWFVDCEGGQRNYKDQPNDAEFIAAANPATIKAMCKLMVQMRDALATEHSAIYGNQKTVEALAAFDVFDTE